ncbi:hypothetical protein [Pontibacter litorisediminis]|uniref:hypothetical protein n=1 Tax=Pontibacter litorisediminis TaxID=1846260 RepID=UPI0023EAD639|nr:hypothetical protein [Pontibacter litorisediminis]
MMELPLPKPILFHPLKHHLGYVKAFTARSVAVPEQELRQALKRIGGSQLDLYVGPLSPLQISEEVIAYLTQHLLLPPKTYRQHLSPGGYRLCTLSDGSAWTLRWGVHQGRHVHLHPGRYALHTLRVKANHLKTALAVAVASIKYGHSINLQLLNQVRAEWLGLSPVPAYTADEGLGRVLELVVGEV